MSGTLTKKQATEVTQGFASIQKQAACLISRAFKTTATEVLNIELHLLLIRLQIK
jgi:UDP-N-acetylglucosamine:LPS N-acetylglucosamine transferase